MTQEFTVTQFIGRVCKLGNSQAVTIPVNVIDMDGIETGDMLAVEIIGITKRREQS